MTQSGRGRKKENGKVKFSVLVMKFLNSYRSVSLENKNLLIFCQLKSANILVFLNVQNSRKLCVPTCGFLCLCATGAV